MSFKEHFWYWIFPTVMVSVLMIFFFSGNTLLAEIVAPIANREWGLLENLQLVIIMGVVVLSFYAAVKKPSNFQKIGFILLGFFAIIVLLEEIDYGAHFRQLLTGERTSFALEVLGSKNIHNKPYVNVVILRSTYTLIFILFAISPFLNKSKIPPLVDYVIPKPRMVFFPLLFLFFYFMPRLLIKLNMFDSGALGPAGMYGTAGNNIGEFTEVIIYWIFFIYTYQIIFEKEWNFSTDFSISDFYKKRKSGN